MNIVQNVSLKDHSTMRLGGVAAYATEVHDRHELTEALSWSQQKQLPVIMVGGGSNIIWRDEGFQGLLIINKILRFEEQQEDEENYYLTVGAGEDWDRVVDYSAKKGLTGIEALSLIPGTAGATPIQNVGAYGQEIADTLVSVEAYDNLAKKFVTLPAADCNFGYRDSRFKNTDRGRFFITAITLHLIHGNPKPPFYRVLQTYLDDHQITRPSPQMIRDAVIAIRTNKLPDPAKVANNGSFFANPIIDSELFTQVLADNPDIPHWPTDDGRYKLPAAWLIERAGFKDYHDSETGMATWPAQCLVLINENAQSTAQLLAFRKKITDAVAKKFAISLQQEPEMLP